MSNIFSIPDEELRKALDMTGGAGLIQEEIDKVIADLVEVNNPLRQNLPRKRGSGSKYIINRRTDRGTGAWLADTDSMSDSEGTYAQVEFAYKTVGFQGKVTRKLQAAGKSYSDILQDEIESGIQVIKDAEEDKLINGVVSGDPKEIDGLITLITGGQVSTLNAELTLDALDKAIDLCIGKPDMLIMSKRSARELNALLQVYQRFVETTEVKGGFRLMSYNGIPIYPSIYISDDESGGATGDSSIYILDTSEVFVGELTALTMSRLAKTSTQFDAFEIYEDMVLVLKNTKKAVRLKGILSP